MGNSCVSTGIKLRRKKSTMGDDYPEGTDAVGEIEGPELQIELMVSNIELKQTHSVKSQFTKGVYGLKVNIDGILEWNYEKAKISEAGTVKLEIKEWKNERHAIIRASEYALKRMFLNFRVMSSEGVEVARLSLNMFLILTGPWRHDFPIKYNQGHMGRLSADIRCTQTIELNMAPTKVQLNFLKEHPGDMFHFTLKTEDLFGNSQESAESYDVQTFLYNKKRKYEVDGQGESATYRNRKTMILENHKGLQWSSSVSQKAYGKELPSFTLPVKVDSISNYGFQFVLWKKSQQDADTFQSYGQANIPLAKLFWTDVKGSNLNPEIGAVRQIEIEEPIQLMGKKCGNMTIRCKVTTPKFFQQVLVLTRTQMGLTQIRSQTASHGSDCDQIRKIRSIKQNMIATVWKTGNVKNELTEKGMSENKEYRNIIYQDILRLERIFAQNDQNHPLFQYSSHDDMVKAQMEMIEIVEKFIPLTQFRQVCISEATWRCMRVILFRGEFLLSKIGFTTEQVYQINNILKSKLPKKLQEKISVAESYQVLILKLLIICLTKLGRKLLKQQLKFIFSICSICYFKVPQFRAQLLRAISSNINIQPQSYCFENCHGKQTFQKLLDWDNLFWKPLSYLSTNNSLIEEVKNINNWKQLLGKKSMHYFMMVQELMLNIGKILGSSDSIKFWDVIPGYDTVVGSYIHQMKIRKITQYPDVMKDANMAFLENECLLPVFIKILLQQTNTFDITCTLKCIQLIGAYFSHVQYNKKMLPSCFDTKLFYIAVKNVIVSENCFTIAKILEVIYLHFNIFSKNFKTEISMLLFGRSFFSLILSWGKIVRDVFKYLIVFRIIVWARQKEVIEVINRWNQLKAMLEQAQLNHIQQSKQEICSSYHRTYHEKMRSKLLSKRRRYSQDLVLKRRARSQTYGFYSQKTEDTTRNSCVAFQDDALWKNTPPRRVKFSQEIELKSMNDFGAARSVSEITDKKSTRNRRPSCYSDFQINIISDKELVYVEFYRKQMMKIEEEFRIWMKGKNDMNDVPRIEIKVPIDEGDMRPQAIET